MSKKIGPGEISLIFTILIILATVLLNQFLRAFSWLTVVAASGLLVLAGLGGALISIIVYRQKTNEFRSEAEELISNLKGLNESGITLNNYINRFELVLKGTIGESLIDYKQLTRIEEKVKENADIWIMTSKLELEQDEEMSRAILSNLRRGVRYRYLLPLGDNDLKHQMKDLAHKWKNDCELTEEQIKEQIQCYMVPQHLITMTIAIYNAQQRGRGHTPTIIIKFPTCDLYSKEDFPLVFCVQDKSYDVVKPFVNVFRELMDSAENKQGPCTLAEVLPIHNA